MQVEEEGGNLRRHDAAHQPRRRLQHRHPFAEQARGGGELEADEAAADDHDILGEREAVAQPARVAGGAQHEDVGEVDARHRRHAHPRARRQHEAVEIELAVVEDDAAGERGRCR